MTDKRNGDGDILPVRRGWGIVETGEPREGDGLDPATLSPTYAPWRGWLYPYDPGPD